MSNEIFRQGDKVYYTGKKYASRLNGKIGWLVAELLNQPGAWSVEFPDTRSKDIQNDSDDYVMPSSSLTKVRPAHVPSEKKEGPEIAPRRKRVAEDEQ